MLNGERWPVEVLRRDAAGDVDQVEYRNPITQALRGYCAAVYTPVTMLRHIYCKAQNKVM
jgi:hypothetical protein